MWAGLVHSAGPSRPSKVHHDMSSKPLRPRAEWQEQLAQGVRDVRAIPGLSDEQYARLEAIAKEYPFFTTPYYLGLIEKMDPSDPIFLQQMPDVREFENPNFLEDDPLDEDCLLYTSPSPRDLSTSRMPSSA